MDYSTLDAKALSGLKPYKLPPTYHLQEDSGNGCFLDPPGYPSYFTRSVYTQHGNSPPRGPYYVLTPPGRGCLIVPHACESEKVEAVYRRLWNPLPLDHPRSVAWLRTLAGYFRSCYADDERPEYGRPGTLIHPLPHYKLKTAHLDPNWTEEYKAAKLAEVEAFNRQERERAGRIATPDNHKAVRFVRKFYPEFDPPAWFFDDAEAGYGKGGPGHWWETEAEQPTPETCKPRSVGRHPVNGSWCQWCGWNADH